MASIEKRTNVWRVVWRQDGKRETESLATERQAKQFAALIEAHGNRWPRGWVKGYGFDAKPSGQTGPTFAEWAARSIASRADTSDRTRHDYHRDLKLHVLPTFGHMYLDDISREHVGKWLIELAKKKNLAGKPISDKTRKNLHGLASSIMNDAVEQRLTEANPFRGRMKKLPSVRQEEMVFLTRGEFDTLLSHVPDYYPPPLDETAAYFRPLVLLLALTGLRWSEATALHVEDVDVFARQVRVTKAWKRTPESYYELGEPKTVSSRRPVSMPGSLIEVLLPLVASRASDEFLFVGAEGRPVRHSNFYNRVWLPAVRGMQRCDEHRDAAGPCRCPGTVAKSPRIHDLRHSHASWLIAAGWNMTKVQRRLGHESILTTQRYTHVVPETGDEISAALDAPATTQVRVS